MIEIGRLCIKTAGRDAGLKCIVVDILDGRFVLIDGETRRRKCNIMHLEPLSQTLKIGKNASHEEIKKEFGNLGLKARETNPKPKTERPRRKRKTPEQLREQKEEKKKVKGIFRKKKEDKEGGKAKEREESSLEEKAGLVGEKSPNNKKDAKKGSLKKESGKNLKSAEK